jgi:hypothetical protein
MSENNNPNRITSPQKGTIMTTTCEKCGGEMIDGRIPTPLKYLFGFKADDQKHFSFEASIQKARACTGCGHVELYLDPQELKAKRA